MTPLLVSMCKVLMLNRRISSDAGWAKRKTVLFSYYPCLRTCTVSLFFDLTGQKVEILPDFKSFTPVFFLADTLVALCKSV
jgi:hypothetical protein